MLTKFDSSSDMNTVVSDAIHSYIKDGYRIDAKESVIDREKDKNCTFKAVLKKDVDGIECKTVIELFDNGDDKNKRSTYHRVETVGDTKWSEETRSLSTNSVDFTNSNCNHCSNCSCTSHIKNDKLGTNNKPDKIKMPNSFKVSKKDLRKSFNKNDRSDNCTKPDCNNNKNTSRVNKSSDNIEDNLLNLISNIFMF